MNAKNGEICVIHKSKSNGFVTELKHKHKPTNKQFMPQPKINATAKTNGNFQMKIIQQKLLTIPKKSNNI